jgi:Flp pilus assembly protein TadD
VALLPVIGLVQVGRQAMADRYTYVPLVGIFVAVAWLASEAAQRWRALRPAVAGAAVLALLASGAATRAQVRHWENTLSLWGHALEVTARNAFAHNQYGAGLAVRGEGARALEHLRRAVALDPDLALAQFNLGRALHGQGDLEGAVLHYGRAAELHPGWADAHHGLGVALAQRGDLDAARDSLGEAVRLAPDAADARFGLAAALEASGRLEAASRELRILLKLQPDYPLAWKRLGIVLTRLGRNAEAREALLRAATLDPSDHELPLAQAVLAARRGGGAEAGSGSSPDLAAPGVDGGDERRPERPRRCRGAPARRATVRGERVRAGLRARCARRGLRRDGPVRSGGRHG